MPPFINQTNTMEKLWFLSNVYLALTPEQIYYCYIGMDDNS